MKRYTKSTKKYLLLASVLMLMLVLCGCRTRLTNNTEVNSSITDEDGMMSQNYEMRREELGVPVAQRPVFTGWGSSEDDYDYSDDEGQLEDYDPNAIDEDTWIEPDDDTGDASGDSGSTTTGTTGRTSTTKNKDNKKKKTESDSITITLDLNFEGGGKNTITAKKDATYGSFLPTEALREGYVFVEWTTDKNNKHPVDLKAKATSSKTLYAHWKQAEEKKETKPEEKIYKITYDAAGGDFEGEKTIEIKDGKFPNPLPEPKRDGYYFKWWTSNGKKVEAGSECSSDQTLKAEWETNSDHWDNVYSVAANNKDLKSTFYSDDLTELIKGEAPAEGQDPQFVITSLDKEDYNQDKANEKADTFAYPSTTKVIVVPSDAYRKDAWRQVYKMILLREMYGEEASTITEADIVKAAKDLGVELPDPICIYGETTPAPAPEPEDGGGGDNPDGA